MNDALLELLACPKCGGDLGVSSESRTDAGAVREGILHCRACPVDYPVRAGIPRFVPDDGYADSFGLQWTLFRSEQLDSHTDACESSRRFFSETGTTPAGLAGRRVLEVGCGAGRFLEVAAPVAGLVVGVDLSRAVEAAAKTVAAHPNARLVQASVYALPFKPGVFDLCYSIGVVQHTPDPAAALAALPRLVKPKGRVAVTVYERRAWTKLNAKYLVRPLTRRLPKGVLLALIRLAAPLLFPVTDALYRVPHLGRLLAFAVPFADYTKVPGLRYGDRYRAAILDTFDMLSPRYDQPQTREEVERALSQGGGVSFERLASTGLTIVARRG
jgi:SAM-dependent methyltransferase